MMKNSFLLLAILIVNVLSVVVIIEDLYEEDLPDKIIPNLSENPSLIFSRSGSSSPEVKNENLLPVEIDSNYSISNQPKFLIYHEENISDMNLTARYSMNEGSGSNVNDTSGNDHNGSSFNSPTWNNSFNTAANWSIDFERSLSQYVEIPDHDNFSFGYGTYDIPFSLEAWVNLEATSHVTAVIVCKAERNTLWDLEYLFQLDNGKIQLTLYDNIYQDPSANTISKRSNVAIGLDEWTHVVATYNGNGSYNGIDLYQNGSLITDTTVTAVGSYVAMENINDPVFIGSFGNSTAYFDGLIDEVRFWNKNLTSTEIADYYSFAPYFSNATELDISVSSITESSDYLHAKNSTDFYYGVISNETVDPEDILAHWKLDEGSGSSVTDSSGNGHDSDFFNNPDWNVTSFNTEANSSLDFNGANDAVGFPDDNDFSFGDGSSDTPFSVDFWINIHAQTSTNRFVFRKAFMDYEWEIFFDADENIHFKFWDLSSGSEIDARGLDNLTVGSWVHVVLTYDGGSEPSGIKVYFNGSPLTMEIVQDDAGYVAMENNNEKLYMGGWAGAANTVINGVLDEIRIWNTNLTASQIAGLFSSAPLYYETEFFIINLDVTYNGTGSVSHVNSSSFFSQTPSDSTSPYSLTFTIDENDTQSEDLQIWVWAYDTVWRNETINVSITRDIIAPTYDSFALDTHPEGIYNNYWKTLFPNSTLVNPSDSLSGLIPLFIEYSLNDSWSVIPNTNDLIFTWNSTHGIIDQYNHTLKFRLSDNVGNVNQSNSDWVICDTIAPILYVLSMDEMFAPNYYDQSIAHTANLTITWSETYPYYVDYAGALTGSDDTSPSDGISLINLTITGESNGWYQINIVIWDLAGNTDSTLTIPIYGFGIIQLDNTLDADEVEVWFYFYFFRSSGLGLDWKDFNVSYIVDEAWYPNITEYRIRGGLFAQKYLNFTSTIRFIVRDYFDNIILNNSYAMPSSRDLYLELAVNTLKVVNLYSDIVNMSIQRNDAIYTEQLMPNEIFAWNLYAAYYNITCILHRYGTYAFDDYDNLLLNYTIDLTSYDFSVFVRDLFTSLSYVIITDQSGNYLDARGFKIYVNEERIYSDTFLWNDTKATKNITITDVFGNLLHQDLTTDFLSFLEITLNIWNVKVFNLDKDPIHLVITQNNLNVSEWIVQYTIEEFYLKNGTYIMYFYYTDIDDDYAIENGTFVTKTAHITANYLIIVQSDDIIAIAVSVDVPQPADPNIEVSVTQNNTEVIAIVEGIKEEVDYVRGEINFIGSFISLSLLLVLIIILMALFLPQRYDQLREKVQEGKVKIYEKGESVKDEYFPEIEF